MTFARHYEETVRVRVQRHAGFREALRREGILSVFDPSRRESLAMLFLDLHRYGYVIGWIFGIWFFPRGSCI
jgi:hypothetical protein